MRYITFTVIPNKVDRKSRCIQLCKSHISKDTAVRLCLCTAGDKQSSLGRLMSLGRTNNNYRGIALTCVRQPDPYNSNRRYLSSPV